MSTWLFPLLAFLRLVCHENFRGHAGDSMFLNVRGLCLSLLIFPSPSAVASSWLSLPEACLSCASARQLLILFLAGGGISFCLLRRIATLIAGISFCRFSTWQQRRRTKTLRFLSVRESYEIAHLGSCGSSCLPSRPFVRGGWGPGQPSLGGLGPVRSLFAALGYTPTPAGRPAVPSRRVLTS